VKGVSGSGTIDVGSWGSSALGTPCAYTSTAWTRCALATTNAGGANFIGNDTRDNGGTARPAQSVYVWGGQAEVGAYATSYIPTTTVAVTRSADVPTGLPVTAAGTGYSQAATLVHDSATFDFTGSSRRAVTVFRDATHYDDSYFPGTYQGLLFDGTTSTQNAPSAFVGTGRVATYFTGTTLGACVNGSCNSSAQSRTWNAGADTVRIGCDGAGCTTGQPDAVVKLVCFDNDPTRCR
jgi:hypothetical protein